MWPNGTPSASPAVQCVMILSCQILCVFSGIQIAKTVEELLKTVEEYLSFKLKALNDGMDAATLSMGFAPMLGVLFIGARASALNLDPVDSAPQSGR